MKNGNLFGVVLFILCLMWFSTYAFATKIGNQEVNISLSETYASRYMWRGQDFSPNNDPVMQPSIDIAFPKFVKDTDVSFNVWGAFPLSAGHESATELDYSVTASRDFLDAFNVSSGYIYFDYTKANKNSDFNEFWGSFTWLELPGLPVPISATLFAGYEFEAAAEGPENGWYYSWGFGTELPLLDWVFFQKDQNLALGVTNWGNDGVAGLKSSPLYATEFSVSTSYSFKKFTLAPGVYYSLNHEEEINSGDDEFCGNISLSYAF
ncbi:hypothetical protein ACFL28_03495 [Candidatus Omnitrophota bacterium]